MRRAYQVPSPVNPPSPPPPQSKVIMQRQYREKEGECFSTLRDVIKQLTGEELQTRQEILRKAIDLLLSVLEIRRQEQVQVVPPAPYEMPVTAVINPTDSDTALVHLAYSPQSSYWSQPWQNAEFDVQSAYYTAQSHASGQQYHTMPNTDTTFKQENWSSDPQL